MKQNKISYLNVECGDCKKNGFVALAPWIRYFPKVKKKKLVS